eukprot:5445951-Karenia_brevis.AAC.1
MDVGSRCNDGKMPDVDTQVCQVVGRVSRPRRVAPARAPARPHMLRRDGLTQWCANCPRTARTAKGRLAMATEE